MMAMVIIMAFVMRNADLLLGTLSMIFDPCRDTAPEAKAPMVPWFWVGLPTREAQGFGPDLPKVGAEPDPEGTQVAGDVLEYAQRKGAPLREIFDLQRTTTPR